MHHWRVMRGIHRWLVDFHHNWPVVQRVFHVIMHSILTLILSHCRPHERTPKNNFHKVLGRCRLVLTRDQGKKDTPLTGAIRSFLSWVPNLTRALHVSFPSCRQYRVILDCDISRTALTSNSWIAMYCLVPLMLKGYVREHLFRIISSFDMILGWL